MATMHDIMFNIANNASPETLNSISGFKAIQNDMVKAAESRRVSLSNEFGAILNSKEGRDMIKTTMMKRLKSDQAGKISRRKFLTESTDIMASDATVEKMSEDIKFLEDRINLFFEKQAEAAIYGEVKGFQQAVLPLLYLESIRNVAREVMPFKVTDGIEIPRQKVNNYIALPNGEEYNVLEAFRSAEIMSKVLDSSNIKKELTIAINTVNDLSVIAGVTQNTLMPVAWLTELIYNDGTSDLTVKTGGAGVNSTALATVFSRGKLSVVTPVKDPGTGATLTTLTVNGEVVFDKGTVVITGYSSDPAYTLVGAKINVTFDGSDFANVIRPFLRTEDKITSISKRLNMSVNYDKSVLKAHLKLDNIDRSIEFTAIMYDTATNAKDFHAFNTIEDVWTALSNNTIAKTLESEAFSQDFKITPTAAFRPVHSREWAAAELPNAMEKVMVRIGKKIPTQAGLQYTFYGDPEATTQVPALKVMIGGDEETYGGVKVENDLMFARIGKFNAKIVTSQRTKDTNYLQCVPYSNSENNEIFAFYQFYTMFDQNNEYRSPLNPLVPSLNLIDVFDTDTIFPILGRVNFVA